MAWSPWWQGHVHAPSTLTRAQAKAVNAEWLGCSTGQSRVLILTVTGGARWSCSQVPGTSTTLVSHWAPVYLDREGGQVGWRKHRATEFTISVKKWIKKQLTSWTNLNKRLYVYRPSISACRPVASLQTQWGISEPWGCTHPVSFSL